MALRLLAARVRALSPRVVDRLVGVALGVLGLAEAATGAVPDGRSAVLVALMAVLCGLVVTERRRRPLPVVLALSAILLGGDAAGGSFSAAGVIALLLALYALGSRGEGRSVPVGAGLAWLALVLDTWVDAYPTEAADFLFVTGAVAAPTLAGRAVAGRRRLAAALAQRAERLEAEQAERAELAAQEERARIAAELHDVVAHALSGMVVQAGAARRLAAADGPAAGPALAAAEETGREALTEMRRLLGVLRREEDPAALAPPPGLGQAARLVAEVRARGLVVRLDETGDPAPLTPGADLLAYRLLERGLEQARISYPGAPVRVELEWAEREVRLEVGGRGERDETTGERYEAGLDAAREHVEVYGGELQAGRRRDGELFVRIRLPLAGVQGTAARGGVV